MKEIWKTYTTTGGKTKNHMIEVSNLGNVKDNGKLIDFSKRANLRYYQVHLFYVHRMVAELFIPNPENKPFIDHINTNKHDNRAENLRWATQTENMNNPLTIKNMKEGWTAEVRKSHAASRKKFADEHPEWKAEISNNKKAYYADPENRKRHKERMQNVSHINKKGMHKGKKRLTDGTIEVLVKPEHWGEFIDIGFHFIAEKNIKKSK